MKGDDKEEYTISAVRENGHLLRDRFGEELWKVALEPECRTQPIPDAAYAAVSIPALSPLADQILPVVFRYCRLSMKEGIRE